MPLRVATFDGGALRNAIPREAAAKVLVPENRARDFKKLVDGFLDRARREELAGAGVRITYTDGLQLDVTRDARLVDPRHGNDPRPDPVLARRVLVICGIALIDQFMPVVFIAPRGSLSIPMYFFGFISQSCPRVYAGASLAKGLQRPNPRCNKTV